jgi:hypothetical protein
MEKGRIASLFAGLCAVILLACPIEGAAFAQESGGAVVGAPITPNAEQETGTPGSSHATTTIDGRYLPPPPQPFTGRSI